MTIQDWGALGEIIGALAVVLSLVYLAIQIRQNNRQLAHSAKAHEISTLEQNIEAANRARELMILNPEVADLFLRGLNGMEGLDRNERFRFDLLMRNTMNSLQGAYQKHLAMGGDPKDFEKVGSLIDSIIGNPGARRWIASVEADWRPQFREYVDQRIAALDSKNESAADTV